jgi:hypothetical protein
MDGGCHEGARGVKRLKQAATDAEVRTFHSAGSDHGAACHESAALAMRHTSQSVTLERFDLGCEP